MVFVYSRRHSLKTCFLTFRTFSLIGICTLIRFCYLFNYQPASFDLHVKNRRNILELAPPRSFVCDFSFLDDTFLSRDVLIEDEIVAVRTFVHSDASYSLTLLQSTEQESFTETNQLLCCQHRRVSSLRSSLFQHIPETFLLRFVSMSPFLSCLFTFHVSFEKDCYLRQQSFFLLFSPLSLHV